MTLRRYNPEMLDQLALRIYDIGASVRRMAEQLRASDVADVEIHDKKVTEWFEKIELWSAKTTAQLAVRLRARPGDRATS